MNRSIFVLLFLFSFSAFCKNSLHPDIYLEDDTIKRIPQINKVFLIAVTVFLDKEGKSNFSPSELNNVLINVNTIFNPIKASFKVCEITYVENFQYDTLNEYFNGESNIKYHLPNRINMFFAADLIRTISKRKDVCGYASLGGIDGGDGTITIKKGDCINPLVIAHELGHFFSLPHTFNGAGDELADGSNCSIAGDGICDTPADPYNDPDKISDYVNDNCVFISEKKDAKGNYYDPDVSNIMGYYLQCVCQSFTTGQYTQMANYYLENPTVW